MFAVIAWSSVARAKARSTERCVASTQFDGSVVPIRIEPAAETIPANALRFYLYFSGNARGVFRQGQATLATGDGGAVPDAFMDFGQELWSADGRRMTLLIDPGRIKRGVAAGETQGPVLRAGAQYRLMIGWSGASGEACSFGRDYLVGPANLNPIDIASWSVDAPVKSTRSPLVIRFDRVMDHALLENSLFVMEDDSRPIEGAVSVKSDGSWSFIPRAPWRAGRHRVAVLDRLEDVSGNRVGEALDHDVVETTAAPQPAVLEFTARDADGSGTGSTGPRNPKQKPARL